jgi:effector-binding domain-containing protein
MEAKARPRTWPYTCGIKDLDGSHVLVRRGEMQAEEVDEFMRRVEEELHRAGRPRQGPPTVVIRQPTGTPGQGAVALRVEVRLPVARGTLPPAGFEAESVPPQPVAYTVHHGRADALAAAEAVLADWVKMKSLRFVSEVRRVYLKRGKNPRKDVTEVQIPLTR